MFDMDCRYYEREFPEVEDLVMVQVNRIEDHGAYVSLLEYGNLEGLILVSELSKRRIRSISKLVRVGQIQCCAVMRVEKGNVDLSKKKVRSDEARLFEAKFANAKSVHSLMRHVASHHTIAVAEVCRSISWPVSVFTCCLMFQIYRQYGNAHEALRRVASGTGDDVLRFLNDNSKQATAFEAVLLDIVRRKLTPQPVKIRCDVEVSCFNYKGVDAVKNALILGKSSSNSEATVSIRLVAPPQYMISTQTFQKDLGFRTYLIILFVRLFSIEECIRIIQAEVEASGGRFAIKSKPQIVGDDDIVAADESAESDSGSESANISDDE